MPTAGPEFRWPAVEMEEPKKRHWKTTARSLGTNRPIAEMFLRPAAKALGGSRPAAMKPTKKCWSSAVMKPMRNLWRAMKKSRMLESFYFDCQEYCSYRIQLELSCIIPDPFGRSARPTRK